MQAFHIVAETPAGSGNYTETGEVITTNADDAVARCVTLNAGGSKHGFWVYESVAASQLLPPGGIGAADDAGTRIRRLPSAPRPGGPTNVDVPYVSQTGSTLNCTMGNWEGEPTSYSYQWQLNGATVGPGTDNANYAVQAADVGKGATCIVTAVDAQGQSTKAPASNTVVVA